MLMWYVMTFGWGVLVGELAIIIRHMFGRWNKKEGS